MNEAQVLLRWNNVRLIIPGKGIFNTSLDEDRMQKNYHQQVEYEGIARSRKGEAQGKISAEIVEMIKMFKEKFPGDSSYYSTLTFDDLIEKKMFVQLAVNIPPQAFVDNSPYMTFEWKVYIGQPVLQPWDADLETFLREVRAPYIERINHRILDANVIAIVMRPMPYLPGMMMEPLYWIPFFHIERLASLPCVLGVRGDFRMVL